MQRFLAVLLDATGAPMSGVTVTVKLAGTSTGASLFSDNIGTVLANPFTNDQNGSFEFYAANGRYDVQLAKAGVSFTAADSTDLLLQDPADDGEYVSLGSDFLTLFTSGSDRIPDGGWHLRVGGGTVALRAEDATYKNGWLDVLESGAVAGSVFLADEGNAISLPFVVGADQLLMEMKVEKIGDAIAGTRRIGLGSASLTADPTNGIYVRQIDAANAFVVSRAASTETTLDLGQTLNNPMRVQIRMQTGLIRVLVDGVHKGTITANIPTANLGPSAGGGATGSAAGLTIDYLRLRGKR